MIFSILVFTSLLIIGGVIWWKKTRLGYMIYYLEPFTPGLESYRASEKTKNRYFPFDSGLIDLSKHKGEYLRFKEINGSKEYLVEPWKRKGDLYLEEGVTKVVIFEPIKDADDNLLAIIPCLRRVETILIEENNNPLLEYKETNLGVSWEGGRKIVSSENLLGVVKYESIQD